MTGAGVEEILLAGDAHYQYRFRNETVEVIREYGMRCVAGNHEAVLLGPHDTRAISAPHVRAQQVAYMREVPDRLTTTVGGRRLTMVHANPWAETFDYLYAGDPRFGRTLAVNPGALMLSRDPGSHGVLTYAVPETGTDDVFVIRDGLGWDHSVQQVQRSSAPRRD
jgi:hypothetical protein